MISTSNITLRVGKKALFEDAVSYTHLRREKQTGAGTDRPDGADDPDNTGRKTATKVRKAIKIALPDNQCYNERQKCTSGGAYDNDQTYHRIRRKPLSGPVSYTHLWKFYG